MAQDQSFGRNVKVRVFATAVGNIGDETIINYSQGYTEFASVQDNGDPGFRIRGKVTQVEATVSMGINPITFSIYNLGPDSRALFQSRIGTKVQILAGYGNNPKQIAVGNVLWAQTNKEGVDYITEVICGDGHFALVNGQISKSFSGSVTFKQLVNEILSNLEEVGISAGNIVLPPDKYNSDVGFNNGYVMSGSPLDILKDLCNKMNRSCTLTSNYVNILPIGVDTGAPVIEVSEDTGLIGIPQVRAPGLIGIIKPSTPVSPQNNLFFTHLLRPEIGLFQRVNMKSKFVNGEYVCGRVVHDFDSWDGPFYTQCEASLGL